MFQVPHDVGIEQLLGGVRECGGTLVDYEEHVLQIHPGTAVVVIVERARVGCARALIAPATFEIHIIG